MNAEKNLTPMQSLEVITSMINQAKGNTQKSSFYFLLWGWTIVVANLAVFLMLQYTDIKTPFYAFALTIPAAIVSVIYGIRQSNQAATHSHLDDVQKWTWSGFGITCFIMVFFGGRIGWQINPVIITMCAAPTFLNGIMIRFKPLVIGGIIFWVLGSASFLAPVKYQFLISSFAVMFGYLIPGYMLKKSGS